MRLIDPGLADAVQEGIAHANSLMTSEGMILRDNGGKTQDPDTLEEVPTYDTIYTGPCRLKFPNTQPSDAPIPGAVGADQSAVLSLPIGAAGASDVTTGDIWECTANLFDPSLVGRRLRVTGVHTQTYATAHRFPVSETT